MKNLTNIRTFIEFNKYGNTIKLIYNGNKISALNSVRFGYGVKSVSTLKEYKTNSYLPIGNFTEVS